MPSKLEILAPISVGELLDKITILQIKLRHAKPDQVANCEREWHKLQQLVPVCESQVRDLQQQLLQVNETIWHLEDAIRLKEQQHTFDTEFIHMARQIYQQNDLRAQIKREINQITHSLIVEEKVFT